MERFDYQKACDSAADAQGVTAIHDALVARGIQCEVWQTGGFTMVCAVPLRRNAEGTCTRYIGCTGEGAGVITEDENGAAEDWTPLCETSDTSEEETPKVIADAVSAWMKYNS